MEEIFTCQDLLLGLCSISCPRVPASLFVESKCVNYGSWLLQYICLAGCPVRAVGFLWKKDLIMDGHRGKVDLAGTKALKNNRNPLSKCNPLRKCSLHSNYHLNAIPGRWLGTAGVSITWDNAPTHIWKSTRWQITIHQHQCSARTALNSTVELRETRV